MEHTEKKSAWKIIGLIWILIECSLVAGNFFGFASLFNVLPRYGIYKSKCTTVGNDCSGPIGEYQRAFALEIGFYYLPAVVVGMINDSLGPRSLKLIAIIFHLIGWLSLAFAAPGLDWLIVFHKICISIAGSCTLISSISISAHFVQHRGLVTSLISGAQLTGSIWYAIFQILVEENIVSLSTLAFIWASFSILMLGSAFLFLDWRFESSPSILKSQPQTNEVKTTVSENTLIQHLKKPLFILVTLFLSCLILTVSFLSVIWPRRLIHLIGNNLDSINHYTLLYNMSAAFGIVVAPLCGFILDYKAYHGYTQKMLNISILQTITWISSMVLCFVCIFESIDAVTAALVILIFSRPILVAGSQALIAAVFPPQFIGSLLGVMWTTVGIISFATYGLVHLASDPNRFWRAWIVIFLLCLLMSGPLGEMWKLYFKSVKANKNRQPPINGEELKTLDDN